MIDFCFKKKCYGFYCWSLLNTSHLTQQAVTKNYNIYAIKINLHLSLYNDGVTIRNLTFNMILHSYLISIFYHIIMKYNCVRPSVMVMLYYNKKMSCVVFYFICTVFGNNSTTSYNLTI